MANEMDRVVPLDRLDDFEIADGDPDVRGWEVHSRDGRRIGEVDNLLIDTGAMKVRYLDVDLDEGFRAGEKDRHVLIPIGYAKLTETDNRVTVDSLSADAVTAIPAYTRQPLTREFETDLNSRFDRGFDTDTTADRAMNAGAADRTRTEGEARMTLSEEELAISKQQRKAGEVEIEKDVETRHVRENVPVSHEEVVVERRPATGMHADTRIEEGEVHVPLTEEELTVNKRTVPREEIVVRKREVVENETVEADLRRERAEVHEEGDVRRNR